MSDRYAVLLNVLIDGLFRKVVVEIKNNYLDTIDALNHFKEEDINNKLKALLPLCIFNPDYEKEFEILEAIRIDGISTFENTKDIQVKNEINND